MIPTGSATANKQRRKDSEKWLGEWMAERGNRDQLVLATKYTMPYKTYSMGKQYSINYSGNHKKAMNISLRDSLAKLGTEYIDILYLHFWDFSTSIEEIIDSLHILVESGKVMYLGISDTPAWIVSAANTYAKAQGKTQFSIYQGEWNIMKRDFEREIIPMARQFGMALAPWNALGGGRIKSKKQVAAMQKGGQTLRWGTEQTESERKYADALEKVGARHGVDSVQAVALAYVLQKTTNVFPVVGGTKVEYLHDNIKALSIHLTDQDYEELESVEEFEHGFPMNFIGPEPRVTGKPTYLLQSAGNWVYNVDGKPIGRQ
jgi:aryl-alcohol dehydrogenase-like predicted oxidoreductase